MMAGPFLSANQQKISLIQNWYTDTHLLYNAIFDYILLNLLAYEVYEHFSCI